MPTKQPHGRHGRRRIKTVATNRKAFHDYFIDDRAEAGLVLTGTEVKSLREGRAQLKDSYVAVPGRGGVSRRGAHLSLRRGVLDEPSSRAGPQAAAAPPGARPLGLAPSRRAA